MANLGLFSPLDVSDHCCRRRCCCCRGYANISVLESVVANYSAAGLPLESLWVDIEYMASRFKTMTFDPGARVTKK
jgi:hypothetical protein